MKMTLQLPNNYVELEQEEMMYLDGGASLNTTAGAARNSLNVISTASTAAAVLAGAGALVGSFVSRVVGGILAAIGGWMNNLRNHASTAHHQANRIVGSHGVNARVRVTVSANWLGWITGMSVVRR